MRDPRNAYRDIDRIREGWGGVPTVEQGDQKALEFANKFCDTQNRFRRWNLCKVARNLAFYRGNHAITGMSRLVENANGGYRFEKLRLPGNREFVIDNFIPEGVDNDVARLLAKQYVPTIRPTRLDPVLQAAAARNKNILLNDLDDMDWPSIDWALYFDVVIGGTCVGRQGWDERQTDMLTLPHPDAARCGSCGVVLASQRVTQQELGVPGIQGLEHLSDADPQPDEPPASKLNACPACGMGELQQHVPIGPDLYEGSDYFGRPMARLVPRGESRIECVSVFEMYFENGGLGVEPNTAKIMGRDSIDDLDWLAARYPEVLSFLKPGDITAMSRLNPFLSDGGNSLGAGATSGTTGAFERSAIRREVVVKPIDIPGLEKGRHIEIVADRVVTNRELMHDVTFGEGQQQETRQVARVTYAVGRYKRIPRQMYGATPTDDAVVQNFQHDRALTQLVALRERGGPFAALPDGAEVDFEYNDSAGAIPIARFRSVASTFDPSKMIVNGQPLTGNAYMPEIAMWRDRGRETLGPNAAESGENPERTETARQLELQIGESRQKRGPVEASSVNVRKILWKAHLDTTWAFRQEEATYEVDDDADTFTQEAYVGTDLLGQTEVQIDAENAQDQSALQAMRTAEAQRDQLIDITDPSVRAKLLKIRGVPDLDGRLNVQVKRSEESWSNFVRRQEVFVVDEQLHDAAIRGAILGEHWESDEGYQLQCKAGWNEILPRLANWKPKLALIEQQDQAQRAVYEGRDPAEWDSIYAQAQQQQQAMQGLAASAGLPGSAMPPVPAPPETPGQFLPEALQGRILAVLQDMVPALNPALDPGLGASAGHAEETALARAMLAFYAGILTYVTLLERKAMAAQAGAMQAPAPGSGMAQPAMPAA